MMVVKKKSNSTKGNKFKKQEKEWVEKKFGKK
jgi:hypothetical protein